MAGNKRSDKEPSNILHTKKPNLKTSNVATNVNLHLDSSKFFLLLLGTLILPSFVSSAFVHPGLLHTQADFDRMAQKVAINASPWIDSWNFLIKNYHASLSYNPNPQVNLSRNCDHYNAAALYNDVAAAYQHALRWKITGNTSFADKSVEIMNAWSSTLNFIGCSTGSSWDFILMADLQGYQFANAGEIMRTYSGWKAADFARFQSMMRNIFYPINHWSLPPFSTLAVYSSWDLGGIASMMAIGVLTDNQTMFNEAINYYLTGYGNGATTQTVYYIHPGYLGQTQESGRDQGHDTLSIAILSVICEQAWNQGVDLYGYSNNRVLAAAEYVAKGNLKQSNTSFYSVPFTIYMIDDWPTEIYDTEFSTDAQGLNRPTWVGLYNHYVNRKGLAAPYLQKMVAFVSPEGGGGDYGGNSGGYDQLGFENLVFTRDNISKGAAPSGLTAYFRAGNIVLSWWGSAYATSYSVKRYNGSTTNRPMNNFPYLTVATNIKDPLTYTDVGISSNTYFYVVTAQTPSGESAPSNIAKVVANPLQLNTYLKFDESIGTVASDSSGNGNNAILVGGASFAPGKKGNAVSLDGKSGYVQFSGFIIKNSSDFTIATWVYLNELTAWTRVFDFGFSIDRWMMFTPQDGSGNASFSVTLNDGPGAWYVRGKGGLPPKQWVHIAITLSGTVGTFYQNGQMVGSSSNIWHAPYQLAWGTNALTPNIYIGKSQYPKDPYLNGLIDEFRIYQGALTASQIASLVNN